MASKKFVVISILVAILLYKYLIHSKNSTNQLPSDVYDDHYWGEQVLKGKWFLTENYSFFNEVFFLMK